MTDKEYLKRCKLLGCNTEQFSYIEEHKEDSYIVDKLKSVLPEASLEQLLSIATMETITQEGNSDAVIALANTFGSEFTQQVIDRETNSKHGYIRNRMGIRAKRLDLGNLVITVGNQYPVKITWTHNNNEHTGFFWELIYILDGHLAFKANSGIMYKLEYDTQSREWYLDNANIDPYKQQKAMNMAGFRIINRY